MSGARGRRTRGMVGLACLGLLGASLLLLAGVVRAGSAGVGWGFNQVTFAALSDLHLGQGEPDTFKRAASAPRLLNETIAALNADRDLDFVLILGDVLSDGEPWNLELAVASLSKLRVPWYVIAGNHDQAVVPTDAVAGRLRPGVTRDAFRRASLGHGFQDASRGYWGLDVVPGLHVVGLDTTMVGTWTGEVDAAQRRWLEAELTLHRDKLTLLLTHHGLVPYAPADESPRWSSFVVNDAVGLRGLLDRFPQVQAVLSGHHHLNGFKTEGKRHYVSVPSLTSWPLAYTRFELDPAGLTAEVKWVGTEADREGAKQALLSDPFWKQPTLEPVGEVSSLAVYQGSRRVQVTWFPWTTPL